MEIERETLLKTIQIYQIMNNTKNTLSMKNNIVALLIGLIASVVTAQGPRGPEPLEEKEKMERMDYYVEYNVRDLGKDYIIFALGSKYNIIDKKGSKYTLHKFSQYDDLTGKTTSKEIKETPELKALFEDFKIIPNVPWVVSLTENKDKCPLNIIYIATFKNGTKTFFSYLPTLLQCNGGKKAIVDHPYPESTLRTLMKISFKE